MVFQMKFENRGGWMKNSVVSFFAVVVSASFCRGRWRSRTEVAYLDVGSGSSPCGGNNLIEEATNHTFWYGFAYTCP